MLPADNFSIYDVYNEVYWYNITELPHANEYTPPGKNYSKDGTTLIGLVGDSNLSNKGIPVAMIHRFSGYDHRRKRQFFITPKTYNDWFSEDFVVTMDLRPQRYMSRPATLTNVPADHENYSDAKWWDRLTDGAGLDGRWAYDVHGGAANGTTNHPFGNWLKYREIIAGVIQAPELVEYYVTIFNKKTIPGETPTVHDVIYRPTDDKWYNYDVGNWAGTAFESTYNYAPEDYVNGLYYQADLRIQNFDGGWGKGYYEMDDGVVNLSNELGEYLQENIKVWYCDGTTETESAQQGYVKWLDTDPAGSYTVYWQGGALDSGSPIKPYRVVSAGAALPIAFTWLGDWGQWEAGRFKQELEFACAGGGAV